MKHKPAACMKRRCRHEAKHAVTFPCAEGTLHRAKPCFIFHAHQRASLKKALACASAFFWLGWPDLNRRVPESKSGALPLGDIPIYLTLLLYQREMKMSILFLKSILFFADFLITFIIIKKVFTNLKIYAIICKNSGIHVEYASI